MNYQNCIPDHKYTRIQTGESSMRWVEMRWEFGNDNAVFNYKEILELPMNPYFPPAYPYASPLHQPYAFGPPVIPQPLAPFPPQSIGSIESMYTAVQPYYSQQFLASTFGGKTEYIQIFLTLSHEDKLKMYLLMEEKKLYGEVGDKEAYQKILRQIVQKLQNFNAFHQGAKQPENSADKKKKDLESKIDSFCEVSFQKLKFPQLAAENGRTNQPKTQELEEIELEDEWVESTAQQDQNELVHESQQVGNPSAEDKFNTFYALDSHSFGSSAVPASNTPVFNMLNFDSDMEQAMTKEIGLKKASQMEKLSIWELEVEESDLKTNLREVFKKKEETADVRNVGHKQEEPLANPNSNANNLDLYTQYSNSQQHSAENANFAYEAAKNQENQGFNPTIQSSQIGFDIFSFGHDAHTTQAPVSTHKIEQIQSGSSTLPDQQGETFGQNAEEQWQDALEKQNSPQKQEASSSQLATSQPQPLSFAFAFEEQMAPACLQVQPVRPNQNLFDFDVLEQKVEIEPAVVNLQVADLFLSGRGHHQPQNEELKEINQDCHQVILPQISPQIIQTVVDLGPSPNIIMNSELFLPDNEKKYEILDSLKIDLSQQQKRTIEKQLKTKSFECNTDFYLKIINYLRELSMESSPEFQHFSEQFRIAKEMHELTMRYTSVVDEQDEEKVGRVIKQSKALYTKIYNKSSLTEKYVEQLLSDKNKQKGLLYKFGRILVDSCINIELISRASAQENRQNVFHSFCLLFTLEKINSLNKLKSIAQALISCTNQEFERFKSLEEQSFREAEERAEEYPQVVTYIKGLLKMAAICQRVIQLLKACFIKTNSNLVKTLKNCKDLKNRFSRYSDESDKAELYPSAFGTILKESIQINSSLYDLHAKFSSVCERNPICQICLLELGSSGQRHEEKGWYHYSCFNLMRSLTNLDYI